LRESVDISEAAVHAAEQKVGQRDLTARLLRRDIRELADLGETFDTVLDCGLYVHVCDDAADRAGYLHTLRAITHPGSHYFMLCFRGETGHHRGHTPTRSPPPSPTGGGSTRSPRTRSTPPPNHTASPAWLVAATRN
jgi:cyclopropane fatty-acyl-phospholipid synthase-like methyltransferase